MKMMKKLLALLLCLVLALVPVSALAEGDDTADEAAEESEEVTTVSTATAAFAVLYTGDNNGYMRADDSHIGYSKLVTFMAQQPEDANLLLLDAGNALGSEDPDRVIKVMGAAGYTAGGIGIKDAELGVERLKELSTKASFPLLCANWLENTGDLYFDPYTVVEYDGLKIGILGLISPSILETLPEITEGDNVYDPAVIADIYHDELVELGCTCFIALTSLGTEGEYNVGYLGASCPWIDVILDSSTTEYLDGGSLITDTDVAVFNLNPDFSSMYVLEIAAGNYGYESIYPTYFTVEDYSDIARDQGVETIINADYSEAQSSTTTAEGTVTRTGGLSNATKFVLLSLAIVLLTAGVIFFTTKKSAKKKDQ